MNLVSEILTENLGMSCVGAKLISNLLTTEQNNSYLEFALGNLVIVNNTENELLKNIINRDES